LAQGEDYNIHFIHYSLLVVAEVTLFFGSYTIYQSTVETITKTAYLKMIDSWLLFCLLIPFLSFMVEVYWFLRHSSLCDDPKKATRTKLDSILNQRFIQILFPTLTVTFIFFYFLAAIIVTYVHV